MYFVRTPREFPAADPVKLKGIFQMNRKKLQDGKDEGNPTQQTTIQEIDAAMMEHEGKWVMRGNEG